MDLDALDARLLRLLRTRGHQPQIERIIAAGSRLGEHGAGWIALGLTGAAADPSRRRNWLRGVRLTAVAYAVNQAIKFTVRRRRPQLPGLPPVTATISDLSFPSAHASTAFAGARAYRGLLPRAVRYVAAGALALSRPYLGVHYPSDVLAGAVLGTVVGSWR